MLTSVVVDAFVSESSAEEAYRVNDPTFAGATRFLEDVAKSELSVLITGETGTGKDVLASTIHRLSERAGPMSSINCAALTDTLFESELFGHERGAFTGASGTKIGLLEAAQDGTVFLDEIGDLPLPAQAKLLRAVESREACRLGSTKAVRFRVRFIAASNRDLASEVAAGRFRADLYFRLAGITLWIPPLRERRAMIAPLASTFVHEAARRTGREASSISAPVLSALEAYAWPGNVRELKAMIERAELLARGAPLAPRHFFFDKLLRRPAAPAPIAPAPLASVPAVSNELWSTEEHRDRDLILRTLEACGGNQTRSAKAMGISRTTLVHKLRLYRIPRPRAR